MQIPSNQEEDNQKHGIIYADLGRAPKTVIPAIPPQAAEHVIYSSVQAQTKVMHVCGLQLYKYNIFFIVLYMCFWNNQEKKDTKYKNNGAIIYADLGVASVSRPIAAPSVDQERIVYASVQQRTTHM